MGTHDRPVDIGRDSLEYFGMVAGFHILEQCLDLSACWVRVCHVWALVLAQFRVEAIFRSGECLWALIDRFTEGTVLPLYRRWKRSQTILLRSQAEVDPTYCTISAQGIPSSLANLRDTRI
jgi:hypothetical protein